MCYSIYWSVLAIIVFAAATFCAKPIEIVPFAEESVFIQCTNDNRTHSKPLNANEYKLNDGIDLEYIQSIEFSRCNLPNVPSNFLQQCPNVSKINIATSGIRVIKSDDFSSNKNLEQLFAYGNELTELPAYLFKNTPKIEEVDFSYNQIEKIHANTFADGVKNLKDVDLSRNRIKKLDGRLFINAISLININLELNEIEYFGLRLVKTSVPDSNIANNNASANCMVFSPRHEKRTIISLTQNKLKQVELECDSDKRHFHNTEDGYRTSINGKCFIIFV